MTDPLERYRMAHAEYRAEVALGWQRQALFLTLSAAFTAVAACVQARRAAVVCAALSAALALAGALIAWRSHTRYRAARAALFAIETELGIADLQTTGGQRAARGGERLERYRVLDVIVAVFGAIALADAIVLLGQ